MSDHDLQLKAVALRRAAVGLALQATQRAASRRESHERRTPRFPFREFGGFRGKNLFP
jgi:hypothetical protein